MLIFAAILLIRGISPDELTGRARTKASKNLASRGGVEEGREDGGVVCKNKLKAQNAICFFREKTWGGKLVVLILPGGLQVRSCGW